MGGGSGIVLALCLVQSLSDNHVMQTLILIVRSD
jgi:hypothetical protein